MTAMASQYALLDSISPSRKGHVASIVLTEPSSFDTHTPSNSAEALRNFRRPAHSSDSSDESRCNSLNDNKGAAATVVELQGLNTLLFGAIQALCQQPGNGLSVSKELSHLAAMASKVPAQDAETFDKYRKDLQDSCRRMASALPVNLHMTSQSEDLVADPFTELASPAPQHVVFAEGTPNSPFISSTSKVIIPRNSSSSSRASSTLSHLSSRRSSRMKAGPNPFEVANSSEVIEEGDEEEEVSVEEVVTPGGSCREVLVRKDFDYLIDSSEGIFRSPVQGKGTRLVASMRSVPHELSDSKDSKQQLADGAAPVGRKAASGQLTDADVAQAISNAGLKSEAPGTSSTAANPFATIRAVVTPSAIPASRSPRPPLHDQGPVASPHDAPIRSASESAPQDDVLRQGKGLVEAPVLNRISDPSPHSSASSSNSEGVQRQGSKGKSPAELQTIKRGSSGRVSSALPPQNLVKEGSRKSSGLPQDSVPEKAKSGCWCF